jgi:hypothetical protein
VPVPVPVPVPVLATGPHPAYAERYGTKAGGWIHFI